MSGRFVFFLVFSFSIGLHGCMPSKLQINNGNKSMDVLYYPGGNTLDDLLIIDGVNYFGKAQYQLTDPLGDIGFRFNDLRRVRAECVEVGKNIIGDDECAVYEVFRSDFSLIPTGITIPRPKQF